MFIVHDDQVRAFAAQRREAFEASAAATLEARLHREVTVDEVHASVERALRRRIENEPEVLQYVALELALGGDLGERGAWATEVLESERLSPVGKVRTLVRAAAGQRVDVSEIDFLGAYEP